MTAVPSPAACPIRLRLLGTVPYTEALTRMREWTAARQAARKAVLAGATRSDDAPEALEAVVRTDETTVTAPLPTGPVKPAASTPTPTPATATATATATASSSRQSTAPCHHGTESSVLRDWPDLAEAATAGDEIWLMQHPPVFTLGMNSRPEHLLDAGDIPVVPTERGGQITYHGPGQIMAYLMLDLRARRLGIRTLVERIESALIDCLDHYGITAFRQEGAPGIYVLPRPAGAPGHDRPDQGLPPATPPVFQASSGIITPPPSGKTGPVQPADGTAQWPAGTVSPSVSGQHHVHARHARPAAGVAKIASIGLKTSHGFSYHGLALNGQMDLSPFHRINPCGFRNLQMTDIHRQAALAQELDLDALALTLGKALAAAIEG